MKPLLKVKNADFIRKNPSMLNSTSYLCLENVFPELTAHYIKHGGVPAMRPWFNVVKPTIENPFCLLLTPINESLFTDANAYLHAECCSESDITVPHTICHSCSKKVCLKCVNFDNSTKYTFNCKNCSVFRFFRGISGQ